MFLWNSLCEHVICVYPAICRRVSFSDIYTTWYTATLLLRSLINLRQPCIQRPLSIIQRSLYIIHHTYMYKFIHIYKKKERLLRRRRGIRSSRGLNPLHSTPIYSLCPLVYRSSLPKYRKKFCFWSTQQQKHEISLAASTRGVSPQIAFHALALSPCSVTHIKR